MIITVPENAEEEKVRSVIDSWAVASNAGDLEAQLVLMTEDVTFLSVGHPPMSRTEFIVRFAAMAEKFRVVCRPEVREIKIVDDMAIVWSRLSVEIVPRVDGASIQKAGDTLTVLRRGSDGRWRIVESRVTRMPT